MRSAFFAALVLGAAAALSNAPAQAGERAFCMKGQGIGSAIGDCSYDTYEQCQATASGRYNYCDANPFFQGYGVPQERRHRRHRSHRNAY